MPEKIQADFLKRCETTKDADQLLNELDAALVCELQQKEKLFGSLMKIYNSEIESMLAESENARKEMEQEFRSRLSKLDPRSLRERREVWKDYDVQMQKINSLLKKRILTIGQKLILKTNE